MTAYGKSPVARALKEFLQLVSLEDVMRRFCQRHKHVLGDSGFTKLEYKEAEKTDDAQRDEGP